MELYISLFLILIVVTFLTEKKVINPATIFLLLWSFIFSLSSLQLYGLLKASKETYTTIFIGVCMFVSGYYLGKILWKFKNEFIVNSLNTFNRNRSLQFEVKYKLIYFLCILTIILYLRDLSITFKYILGGGSLASVRQLAQDSYSALNTSQSGILVGLRNMIITPFTMVLQPIVAIEFWFGNRNSKLLILNVVILILRILTDGSRSILVYFVFHFLIAFVIYRRASPSITKKRYVANNRKKNVFVFLLIFFIGISLILWTTLSRSGENALKYSYFYFAMEPLMFEQWSNIVTNLNIIGHGQASMNGFSFAILYFLKNLKIISQYPLNWQEINTLVGFTQTQWQIISVQGSRANAYVSLFWYFFLDGRILGIIFGSLSYGTVLGLSFVQALKKRSVRAKCVFLFLLQGLIMSFVRFQFSNLAYAIAFCMIFLFYKKCFLNISEELK